MELISDPIYTPSSLLSSSKLEEGARRANHKRRKGRKGKLTSSFDSSLPY